MKDLDELVLEQALAELPQIVDVQERQIAVETYINDMTNLELIKLLTRSIHNRR